MISDVVGLKINKILTPKKCDFFYFLLDFLYSILFISFTKIPNKVIRFSLELTDLVTKVNKVFQKPGRWIKSNKPY